MDSILVTGARGQIGSDLVAELRARHSAERVIATDLQSAPGGGAGEEGVYEALDVRDTGRFRELVERYEVREIYHLASLLSATGEQKPELSWEVNLDGLRNVLELARERAMRVFWPSSIAVFGPETPRVGTPQHTVLDPTTMYGITKVTGELLCRYYHERWGVDVRSVRFPGLISYNAPAGGGTTDYAVNIFYDALQSGEHMSFVGADTVLPMMYMPDAVRSILELMRTDTELVRVRTSYNLTAVSFSAAELAAEIRKHIPRFECRYAPDYRQQIADSWPAVIDDAAAREQWGWRHEYGLPEIVADMLDKLGARIGVAGMVGGTASSHP